MVFRLPKLLSTYTDWLEKQQNSILSAAVIITVANIASALSGLVRQRLLISHFFDTLSSQQAYEAFLLAFQIPDLMFQLIVLGAVSAAFIPILSMYKNNKEEELRYMNSMMNSVMLLFIAVGVLVFIFAEPLTKLRTGDAFTAEQLHIAVQMTRIMVFAQFFFAISNFFTGMLQSYKRFIVPALAPILYNVGILLGAYLLSPYFGIYAAGIGVVLGAALHMVIQTPLVFKLGFRFKPIMALKDPAVVRTYKLTPARTASLAINQVQQLADGFFTTSIGKLSYLIMNLAFSLMTMPIRFFGVPISQAALPFLSDEANSRDLGRFKDLVLKSIHQIAFLAYPASVLLLILRVPIVRIAYGTHNFPWETTLITGRVVAIISLSIAAQSIVQLLIRSFYALKDTKTPLYITIITVVFYMIGSALSVFVFKLGVIGMATVLTVANIIEMLLFLYCLDKRVSGFARKEFWIPQIKMIITSFLMAIFLYLPFRILDELVFDTTRTIELILLTLSTGTIGMLVYIYFALLLDIRELYIITSLINKFGNWQKPLAKSEEVLVESPSASEDMQP
ncbi:murein biosynthesis integral membrane protein MurJ [Patescibacteria group bacterium]|nr:murein biosynthesis integral membrane protein MurJ [Patescibacteria group bacterium]